MQKKTSKMSNPVAVIRTSALAPLFIWMQQNHKSIEPMLARAELTFVKPNDPFQIIPLQNVARLLVNESNRVGPDFPLRIACETSALHAAMIAPVIAGARTPRDALTRVSAALPFLSSHEHLAVEQGASESTIRHFWGVGLDDEAIHYLQQFTAAMLDLLIGQLPANVNKSAKIAMQPHPNAGLEHLQGKLHGRLVAGNKILTVRLSNQLLQAPFQNGTSRCAIPEMPHLESLREVSGHAGTVRILVRAMLEIETPTSAQLARAAGLSQRTLQRRLSEEGTSFAKILDEVRRETALDWLALDAGPLADLSNALGYAHPSAFTRAMRRWVGQTPKQRQKQRR